MEYSDGAPSDSQKVEIRKMAKENKPFQSIPQRLKKIKITVVLVFVCYSIQRAVGMGPLHTDLAGTSGIRNTLYQALAWARCSAVPGAVSEMWLPEKGPQNLTPWSSPLRHQHQHL